jgi:hypothetical protein
MRLARHPSWGGYFKHSVNDSSGTCEKRDPNDAMLSIASNVQLIHAGCVCDCFGFFYFDAFGAEPIDK